MDYTIYVFDNCPNCEEVLNFCKQKKISFQEQNLLQVQSQLSTQIFVAPALVQKGELLAYGTDIISYFEKLL